jgi:hypothetical protein
MRHSSRKTWSPDRLSAEQRDLFWEAIRRELALEYLLRTNAKREAWARIAIGLPPYPKPLYGEQSR